MENSKDEIITPLKLGDKIVEGVELERNLSSIRITVGVAEDHVNNATCGNEPFNPENIKKVGESLIFQAGVLIKQANEFLDTE